MLQRGKKIAGKVHTEGRRENRIRKFTNKQYLTHEKLTTHFAVRPSVETCWCADSSRVAASHNWANNLLVELPFSTSDHQAAGRE